TLVSHFTTHVRCNNHVVPPPFERFSEDAFRKAVVIDIRGIEEVDSGFQAPIHYPDSVCFRDLTSERHGAYGDSGYLKICFGQSPDFHGSSVTCTWAGVPAFGSWLLHTRAASYYGGTGLWKKVARRC